MRKGIITLIALALLMPVTLMAQGGPPDKPFYPQGQGPGQYMMGQGHRGHHGGGFGPMADRPGMGHHGGGIGLLLMVGDKIDLTDQQRDRLKEMQTEFQMSQIDRKAELEKAQVRLRTLRYDQDAAEGDVFRAIDEMSRLRADMQKMRYQHRQQIKAVLTDEQVEKLKELRQARRDGMGQQGQRPMGRRGGNGGGGRW